MDPILAPLNDKQREAVQHTDGALLLLAGAGSGKTRVITHRFAYILKEKHLRLSNILAVTFTNKAASEMKNRISQLVKYDVSGAWIRTFHSMGMMILKKNPEAMGYPKEFVIYDDTDSKNLIRTIMKELQINTESFNPAGVAEKISSLKDNLISPDDFEKMRSSSFDDIAFKVFGEYERNLRKNKALDFPDLIGLPIRILSKNQDILNFYQDLWPYMMVDEFQDTNSAQYKLINLIGSKNKNICVVGDDDQSIYGWRGANVDNIYDFESRYQAKVIALEQNYRSTSVILSAANSVVSKISGRMEKKLWTEKKEGEKIRLIEVTTDRDEARMIVDQIKRFSQKYEYQDFAVFYRTNAQSRIFEESLLSENIPYKIFGGQKFYERKEIKDILAYIKQIVNPFDSASFDRIINVPKRKIGEASQIKIKQLANERNISFIEALLAADEIPQIQKNTVPVIKELGQILLELNQSMDKITPTNFVKILLDAIHYRNYILDFDQDGLDRWSNVEELINSIKEYEEGNPEAFVADFINEVTLQTSVDGLAEDQNRNYVSLMTIHNAKGLEFPVVFICGVVDGLLPHASSSFSQREMNEERRLFYVAITRAKENLFLSYPENRFNYGELMSCLPSPFLKDIPEDLLEHIFKKSSKPAGFVKNTASYRKKTLDKGDKKEIEEYEEENIPEFTGKEQAVQSLSEINQGDKIIHKRFGRGKVTFVSDKFIKVDFEEFGVQNMSGNFLANIRAVKDD
jgi:DNA helicase-2/ATP-dependent DNA helicase PcrA